MLDMNKLRSEFEATPEIKAHLDHGNVFLESMEDL